MDIKQKILIINARSGYYKMERYSIRDFMGPVDFGLFSANRYKSLNIGIGLLSGSIFPGSNRLIFCGYSPCWGGFYISSMGGAGLVFDNLGINTLSIMGQANTPSILYLNRIHGEEVQVKIEPVNIKKVWNSGRGGIYSLFDYTLDCYGQDYETDPRILAVGPAALCTDIGAICSVPIKKGKLTYVDTWAGRGGLGSKLLQEHGIAAVIYGGTFLDEDFRNRKVADEWFKTRYDKKLATKDFEATTKYRFEPKFETGGTFGVNYASLGGKIITFNYSSIYQTEEERLAIHKKFIVDHYLKQFNIETIQTKQQKTCGEPCVAVCKKMNNEFKKDYEPYQALGPLCGIFDQRAAEKLTHEADKLGFDAISVGGILAWLMESMAKNLVTPKELGSKHKPVFSAQNFNIKADSAHNAQVGMELLESIIKKRGKVDLQEGARKMARHLARQKGKEILDLFVYNAFARKGWMVPNQYWVPGVLSPMPIMGKYYMYYGSDFLPPRELGRKNAENFKKELVLDNLGFCRFHRKWAAEMLPEILETLYGVKKDYLDKIAITASRINSRNASVFWESERCEDFIYTFMKRKQEVEKDGSSELKEWIKRFKKDKHEAALQFWYEIHKGAHESLREF